ncbi:MAG: hypothetical protein RI932_757, partial [Pseudomonadota bacterium]
MSNSLFGAEIWFTEGTFELCSNSTLEEGHNSISSVGTLVIKP